MLHVGLDLCRSRVDVHVLDGAGHKVLVTRAPSDADALVRLAGRVGELDPGPVSAVLESMTGARFVRDTLAGCGWDVQLADAAKVKGLAPMACKTDKIDARVLAELSYRDLVPAIWLPDMPVRQARELARWRLHLVKHRSMLKTRIHATMMTFGVTVDETDLFGTAGRHKLAGLQLPQPWAGNVEASLVMIDTLDEHIDRCEAELRRQGASHPYVPRLMTVPGIAWVLAYTIAAEIGDIHRFASAKKFVSYTGLCPRVYQSGDKDHRGPLTKTGPKYLRWALIEAAVHASGHAAYAERHQRTKKRLGRQRGARIARVQTARAIAVSIWHMLTRDQDFAPAGAENDLAA